MGRAGEGTWEELRNVRDALRQAAESMAGVTTAQAGVCAARTCRVAGGRTAVVIALGATVDFTVTWPNGGFPTDAYAVDVVPWDLDGAGAVSVLSQTATDVTIRITASLLIAAGARFLVHGRS